MPEEDESLSLDEENGQPAGKKKLIVIVAAVLTLLIAGGVAFFVFSGDDSEINEEVVGEVLDEEAEKAGLGGVNYVAMPRPLVFNVMEGKRDRTVQIKVQLMVISTDNEVLARRHIPLLEGTLVRVFGAATAQQLRTPEGKAKLRETALTQLNEATTKLEGRALIHTVLFTGFVLQ